MTFQDEEVFYFDDFQLIPERSILLRDSEPVKLGRRALSILIVLVRRAGIIVTNRELIELVWEGEEVEDSNVRVHLTALRRALGEGPDQRHYVVNVPGRGYQFVAPLRSARRCRSDIVVEEPTHFTKDWLIGREGVADALLALLAQRRMITLVGAGGIGKTALARAVASRRAEAAGAQTAFVELEPLTDARSVHIAIAGAIGLPHLAHNFSAAALRGELARRTILVLDGCEHLLDLIAGIAESLVSETDGVTIIATSREPLRATGEWVQRLQPLLTPPDDLVTDEVLEYPAVQLFIERALAISDTFSPSRADMQIIANVVRKLDGIPLALELAAARVDMFSLKELWTRLGRQLAVLSRGTRTSLPRHRTMRSTIDWSYRLLDDSQRRLLNRLSVFVAPFTMRSVESLGSLTPELASTIVQDFVALVEKSLVVAEALSGRTRYRLLSATREYAMERLEESGEAGHARRWHARYVLAAIRNAGAQHRLREPDQDITGRTNFIQDVRAAARWAVEADELLVALELLAISNNFWCDHSVGGEYEDLSSEVLGRVDVVSTPGERSEMLAGLLSGQTSQRRGDHEEAVKHFKRAIEMAGVLGETWVMDMVGEKMDAN